MAGTCADHGPAGSGTREPSRDADPGVQDGGQVAGSGQVPFADRVGEDLGGVQAGQFGGAQGPPQPPGLVAGARGGRGGQGGREQVAVALLAGRGGFGGPDRVQQGQVVGVGEGLLAGLGGRALLAVAVQDRGQHAQRLAGRSGRGGGGWFAGPFGMNLVVAGQFGSGPGAGDRVGAFGGDGEHVGEVGVGAAGQRDVGVLAVLGPGDHRQAGVHGAALGDMIGDRVPQFGVAEKLVQESAVGPPAAPGGRVGVQGPAHDQPVGGDGLDAQQVPVGQRPAGLAGLDGVVVAGAGDQVAGAGLGAVGDADRGPGLDDAQGDEVVADAAGQLAAQRVLGGHEQGVGAVGGQGDVGGRGGVDHLLGVAAVDAAVLVVVGEHGGVAVAQPQAGVPVPRRRGTGPVRRAGRSRGRRRAGTCRRRSRRPAAGWCPRPGSASRRGPRA